MGSQETYWRVESEQEARDLARSIDALPENRMLEDLTFVNGVGFATLKVDVDTPCGMLKKGDAFLVVSGERHPFQDRGGQNPLVRLCGTEPIPLELIHGVNIDPGIEDYVKF